MPGPPVKKGDRICLLVPLDMSESRYDDSVPVGTLGNSGARAYGIRCISVDRVGQR